MIIRPAGDHLLFITQPDHAHLARRLMEACATLSDNPRRDRILHAIGEHDNGWTEPDAAPIVDPTTGTPVDFVAAPLEVRQGAWPRAVRRLADDPWAAALVAQHAITVYDRYRPDPAWVDFFKRMERLRDEMRRASDERDADLDADYAFLRLGDLISLSFCTGWTETLRFDPWTVTRSGDQVHVRPDPFAGVSLPVEVAARRLRPGSFASNAELRAEFDAAHVVLLKGAVTGSGTRP